jgi:F-type H+-transporting ATPase subunit alpha
MAQYQSLAAFTQFGASDLDAATRRQLERGERLTELLKQRQYAPLSMEAQVSMFYLAGQGLLDDLPVAKVFAFEQGWYDYAAANIPDVLKTIAEKLELSDDGRKRLDEAGKAFKQTANL